MVNKRWELTRSKASGWIAVFVRNIAVFVCVFTDQPRLRLPPGAAVLGDREAPRSGHGLTVQSQRGGGQ